MSPHLATREAEVDMKSTRHIQLLAAVSMALTILPAIEAEPRCPGNTASVTPRFVQHALIVIPVRINESGPVDFMVGTGSQVTVIDPSLAAQFDLNFVTELELRLGSPIARRDPGRKAAATPEGEQLKLLYR
jgi:hypothetical protein